MPKPPKTTPNSDIDGIHQDEVRHTDIAAVATPPDVISQFMLSVPLILLYELSLVAIWFTERRRGRGTAAEVT